MVLEVVEQRGISSVIMNPMKSPSPDGFSALFKQKYSHVIGLEVTTFILNIALETYHAIPGLRGSRLRAYAIKLDMMEAYDSVKQSSLHRMMISLTWLCVALRLFPFLVFVNGVPLRKVFLLCKIFGKVIHYLHSYFYFVQMVYMLVSWNA